MEKNILIEEADEHLRLITETELKEIEDSAEEFDGFTGIRVVGRVQPKVKPKIAEELRHIIKEWKDEQKLINNKLMVTYRNNLVNWNEIKQMIETETSEFWYRLHIEFECQWKSPEVNVKESVSRGVFNAHIQHAIARFLEKKENKAALLTLILQMDNQTPPWEQKKDPRGEI